MENPRKIDRSFKERQGVLHLLEKLKKENITYAEMDEIGALIRKAGRSAVQPLLRRISHEKSGSLISKYTYLLEFLDERYWLDQIIQIALKRRDLELEGKSALLATLDDCGIDLSLPPFSSLLSPSFLSPEELSRRLMENDEDSLIALLEEFAGITLEGKCAFLQEITRLPAELAVGFLELLLWYDEEEVVKEVVTVLGRVRAEAAAAALTLFRRHAEPSLQGAIDQSLRRLAFVGVKSGSPFRSGRPPFHSAYAGPVDGNGFRYVLLARWRDDGRVDSIDLQLHDIHGLEDISGKRGEVADEYAERSALRAGQEIIEPIAPEYALELLRDALYTNREQKFPLPPEFMLRRGMFDPEEIRPALYTPPIAKWSPKATPALLAMSAQLFEEEFFAGWAAESCPVYDIAEKWMQLEKRSSKKELGEALEQLIEELCRDEFQHKLGEIAHRLVLNADFLARTGMDGELVKSALAAAESMREFSLPCHLHPFLRRFAMESMIVAREALEEGYDFRDFHDDWD